MWNIKEIPAKESYIPLSEPLNLHYRHAQGENLLLVSPSSNAYKIPWVRSQIAMFSKLGWEFILLDLSERSDLGPAMITGGKWSSVEYHALANLHAPVTVRVLTLGRLLETLDEIHVLKETSVFPHVVVVHLGGLRDITDTEQQALQSALERIKAYHDGVWVIAESFQPFWIDKLDYHTECVLAHTPKDGLWDRWVTKRHLEEVAVDELEDNEGYFLFRGRSEGADRLLIAQLKREGYAWEPYTI